MPTLSVTNLTASRLPVGQYVGVIDPNATLSKDLQVSEIEQSKEALVNLAAKGLISWKVAGTLDTADDMADGAMGGGILLSGTGSPETAVAADPGTLYLNTAGGAATTLYVKESGTSNTGWIAK